MFEAQLISSEEIVSKPSEQASRFVSLPAGVKFQMDSREPVEDRGGYINT